MRSCWQAYSPRSPYPQNHYSSPAIVNKHRLQVNPLFIASRSTTRRQQPLICTTTTNRYNSHLVHRIMNHEIQLSKGRRNCSVVPTFFSSSSAPSARPPGLMCTSTATTPTSILRSTGSRICAARMVNYMAGSRAALLPSRVSPSSITASKSSTTATGLRLSLPETPRRISTAYRSKVSFRARATLLKSTVSGPAQASSTAPALMLGLAELTSMYRPSQNIGRSDRCEHSVRNYTPRINRCRSIPGLRRWTP